MPLPQNPFMADQAHEADRARPEMLNVQQVADILGCSPRHVYRLADSGKMPKPVRIGALVRWDFDSLASWINEGCPATSIKNGSVQ